MFNRRFNMNIDFNAMIQVKLGRPLVNYLIQVIKCSGARLSLGYIKVIITFLSHISRLVRHSGVKFTTLFLKAQYVNQQQSLGGKPLKDLSPLKCRFSRTNRGLPRIIPAQHRTAIRRGSTPIIKFWLSQFSVYRVLEFPYKLSQESITQPIKSRNLDRFRSSFNVFLTSEFIPLQFIGYKTEFLKRLCSHKRSKLYWGELLRVKSFLTANRGPCYPREAASSPRSLVAAIQLLSKDKVIGPAIQDFLEEIGDQDTWRWLRWGYKTVHRISGNSVYFTPPFSNLGKLEFKEEPAGKLRVFAMQDIVTQWVFKSQHDRIFEILALIPSDGTFNQPKPIERQLKRLPKGTPYWSLDLSSATDRIPAVLARDLLASLTSETLADNWLKILTNRNFVYSYKGVSSGSVQYSVGQPMGALTSWSLGLALLHHALVQYSAYTAKVTDGTWFHDYALLGDDIVIANQAVAEAYIRHLKRIGVECGIAKSLISEKGIGIEFAKRFYYKGEDCSPVPLKELKAACQTLGGSIEQARKYSQSITNFLYLLGYNFRSFAVVSKDLSSLSNRLAIAIASYNLMISGDIPVPRNWNDPTSVQRTQRRLDCERNVLDSLQGSMQRRCRRQMSVLIKYPKYFGDPIEGSGLLRSNPDFYESENLPKEITNLFFNEQSPDSSDDASVFSPEGQVYSQKYWDEISVDRELWIEQTYRVFYQETMRKLYGEQLLFEKELLTESASSIFAFRYTRLLMIDKRLSEISDITVVKGTRADRREVSKPHVVVRNFLYFLRKV